MQDCRFFRSPPIETIRILRILEILVSGVGLQPLDAAVPNLKMALPCSSHSTLALDKNPGDDFHQSNTAKRVHAPFGGCTHSNGSSTSSFLIFSNVRSDCF